MGYKVIHPDGSTLDPGLDETDAKGLAVRVFHATGEPCTLVNLHDDSEQTFPDVDESQTPEEARVVQLEAELEVAKGAAEESREAREEEQAERAEERKAREEEQKAAEKSAANAANDDDKAEASARQKAAARSSSSGSK